jgi:hypothetical protein
MSLEENFIAELSAAADSAIESQKPVEENKQDAIVETAESKADENKSATSDKVAEGSEDGVKTPEIPDSKGADNSVVVDDKVQVKQPSIGDYALTQAVKAGFSIEEAREFGSEKLLSRAVDMVIAASVKPDAKAETKKQDDILDGLPTLDPENYEPDVIKTFDALKDVIKRQQEAIEKFQEYTQQSASSQQEAAAREVEQWFDSQVNTLGKDFEDALGVGSYYSMNRESPQFQKRDAIADQMAILIAGYQSSGRQMPPREDVFRSATQMVLREEYQAIHEKKLSADLAKQSTQHINRATGAKSGGSKNPMDETAALLDEKYFPK